ncbi:MAG: glycoside hydrolase family 108 protein [Beijerinckiaceae bacterium]|jgi:lysozyme family protein|nr:glycoside hydrolase family 108 protein [Beijerinckiaceae bacterium]
MAAANFERALALVLQHEGGYSDHPSDPGGATMMGITQATLAAWRGRPVEKAEVRSLTRAEAGAIYRAQYWDALAADHLPHGVDLAAFDYAVNSGPSRAARTLQGLVAVTVDGRIGPQSLAALDASDAGELIRALCAARMRFLQHLPTFAVFGRGWTRRVTAIEQESLKLARLPTSLPDREAQPEEKDMFDSKALLQSRTVWANVVGLGSLALSVMGFQTVGLDQSVLTDRLLEVVAAGSFVASTIFRVIATKRLS